MAFIRNTDKLIEGSSKLFFSNVRAKAAVQSDLNSLSAGISSEQSARESEDSGIKIRLGVIEGGAGVSGSIAKAQADAQAYADQKVAALVNSAPSVLDTLKELSDAIGGDASFASTIAGQIGAVDDKVDQEILDRQAAISQEASSRASAVSAEQSARQSADSALSGRIASLEADPVTKTYVDGIQSSLDSRLDILEQDETTKAYVDQQVAAEQSRAQGAEGLLDGRLDVLESDPTTKTYVDGKVATEKTRAEGAESALSGRVASLEADPTTKAYVDGIQSALDGRLDLLELDPVSKTYVDSAKSDLQGQITAEVSARQSAVSSEASARQSADQALDGRLDVLELDPVSKTYVDGEVSDLQGQVNTEKGRVDAILLASDADKNSFAEIVSLINSVDTANDSAFAGYVLSNNAALAQEVSDRQSAVSSEASARQSADNALDGRLDVLEADPTTRSYVDGEVASLEAEDLTFVKTDGSRPVALGASANAQLSVDKSSNSQFGLRATSVPSLNGIIGALNFQPFNGSGYSSSAKISALATEEHGPGRGSKLQFEATVEGSISRTTVLEMYGSKVVVQKPIEVPVGFEMVRPTEATRGFGKMIFENFTDPSGNEQTQIKFRLQRNGSDSSERLPMQLQADTAIFGRGLAYRIIRKSANYSVPNSEPIQVAQAVNITFTLPSAPVQGQMHTFKDSTGNCSELSPITISTGVGTIDGQSTFQLTAPYESVSMIYDSTLNMWLVL